MLTPPRTLTVGQLQECFKCLKQQPSHLTLSEVSKQSLNAGVSKSSRERADKGQRRRRPSKPRQREASWQAHSQSDMPKGHVANTGKRGPYECGVPAKVVRMPGESVMQEAGPAPAGPSASTTATVASLHFHHSAAGCAEAGAP